MRFKTLTGAIRTVKKSKNFLIDWDGKSRSKIQFNVKQYLKKYWLKHIVFEEFPVAGTYIEYAYNPLSATGSDSVSLSEGKYCDAP